MPRRRTIEAKITEYFETADLQAAKMLLGIVVDTVARREEPKRRAKKPKGPVEGEGSGNPVNENPGHPEPMGIPLVPDHPAGEGLESRKRGSPDADTARG